MVDYAIISAVDRRWILGGLLFAGGVGIVRVLTNRPKLDENSRILVIGDSFARGLAPHLDALAEDEDLPLHAMGISGTVTVQWVNSTDLSSQLASFKPTHVFVSLGGNDSYTNFSPEDVAEDSLELVEKIQTAGAHPIWIGVPPMPRFHGGNEINPDTLMAVKDAVPFYFDSSDLVIPREPDGLHPTAAGYAGWAGAFWNWIA